MLSILIKTGILVLITAALPVTAALPDHSSSSHAPWVSKLACCAADSHQYNAVTGPPRISPETAVITATATFDQSPNSQTDNTGNETIEEIINNPEATSNKHKNSGYDHKLPTRVNSLRKKNPVHSSRRIKISGYFGQTFVYGEVIPLKNGKLEGYIYNSANSKTYVYGEKNNDMIKLYDTNGNLYQMVYQQ